MGDSVKNSILGFFERVGTFWSFISSTSKMPFIILDVLVVAILIYWLYILIRETRAWRIMLGLVIIFIAMLISKLLGLITLNWIFKNFTTVLIVAIPVVFQPELRMALEKLGRIRLAEFPQKGQDLDKMVDKIVDAADNLAKARTGALIVIQRKTGLKDYAETGTVLNADLSSLLLSNIFQKNAPLHDGAVIVIGSKIKAAGCLLPLEDTKINRTFGARHQSALALSKETDALIIVVSEENGKISLACGGEMTSGISPFDLKTTLLSELRGKKEK